MKKILYLIFSLSVTAGVFYYLLSEISISDVLKLISNVDRHGLLLFVTCSLAMSFFITWRYKLLISVSGFSPSPVLLFLVVLVRNLFADLLPARIGTFVYIYIVNSRLGVALSAATSSFVLATLLDILALMILLIVLVGVGFDALPPAYLLAFAILIGGIIWVVIYNLPRLLNWLVQILPKSPTMEKLTVLFSSIEREVTASRQAGVFTRLIALSLLVRITKYA
ncbi:MAG: lysylphosphatidylglycerol synthase domain-containing protein, partial [Arenicellales bacterium]|nr:lysylphosphatidylglycerol synthase domain-containing protein [Arenicellales bacterium]